MRLFCPPITSPLHSWEVEQAHFGKLSVNCEEKNMMEGKQIGVVTHFYGDICVIVVYLTDKVEVGDDIHILGRTTDFKQKVKSMQIEHDQIEGAGAGMEVAIKAERRVRRGDKVFKLIGEE
jgi:putative protease